MKEVLRIIVKQKAFTPIYGEDGKFPLAPPEAIAECHKLKNEWFNNVDTTLGEPSVNLRPVRTDGLTRYLVTQEIISFREI